MTQQDFLNTTDFRFRENYDSIPNVDPFLYDYNRLNQVINPNVLETKTEIPFGDLMGSSNSVPNNITQSDNFNYTGPGSQLLNNQYNPQEGPVAPDYYMPDIVSNTQSNISNQTQSYTKHIDPMRTIGMINMGMGYLANRLNARADEKYYRKHGLLQPGVTQLTDSQRTGTYRYMAEGGEYSDDQEDMDFINSLFDEEITGADEQSLAATNEPVQIVNDGNLSDIEMAQFMSDDNQQFSSAEYTIDEVEPNKRNSNNTSNLSENINKLKEPNSNNTKIDYNGVNKNIQPLFNEYKEKYNVGNLGIWGDKSHQQRKSDHNTGDAIDLDTHGNYRPEVVENLIKEADQRNIKYIIHNGKIWSKERANEGWRNYTGKNPHKGHVHVSFYRKALGGEYKNNLKFGGQIEKNGYINNILKYK